MFRSSKQNSFWEIKVLKNVNELFLVKNSQTCVQRPHRECPLLSESFTKYKFKIGPYNCGRFRQVWLHLQRFYRWFSFRMYVKEHDILYLIQIVQRLIFLQFRFHRTQRSCKWFCKVALVQPLIKVQSKSLTFSLVISSTEKSPRPNIRTSSGFASKI